MGAFKKDASVYDRSYSEGGVSGGRSSIIGKTLSITGEIISNEEVIIEGKIDGKINAKNRVIVGKTGMVNADIDARELVVEGRVNGNVKLTQRIEIVPEGVLRGNINSSKVVLAEGSIFKGKIDMPIDKGAFPDKKPLSTEEKSEGDKD